MKICVISDNHGDLRSVQKIAGKEFDCDYYLHLGDVELPPSKISPFIAVRGNNDYDDYPEERILELEGHRILMIHGSWFLFSNNYDNLLYKAEEENCDIVLFGHSHRFTFKKLNGIYLINPGSTFYNRDGSKPGYIILYLNKDGSIEVYRKTLD